MRASQRTSRILWYRSGAGASPRMEPTGQPGGTLVKARPRSSSWLRFGVDPRASLPLPFVSPRQLEKLPKPLEQTRTGLFDLRGELGLRELLFVGELPTREQLAELVEHFGMRPHVLIER